MTKATNRLSVQRLASTVCRLASVAAVVSVICCTANGAPFLVASDFTGQMRRVDPQTGAILSTVAGGNGAGEIDFGPDGLIYASDFDESRIRRIDPISGLWIGTIALPGKPRDVTFGPDGQLYIGLTGTGNGQGTIGVYRYDLASQQLSSRFNTSVLNGSPIGITFGPGNDLWVALDARFSGNGVSSIVRIDGQTGNFEGVFTSQQINAPQSLVFDLDGNLDVANSIGGTITQYAPDGSYLGTLTSGGAKHGLFLLPDGDLLYGSVDSFYRIDAESHAISVFSTGFRTAAGLVMVPEPTTMLLAATMAPFIFAVLGRILLNRPATP